MKITTVKVERTFNLGNYESDKISFEAQLSEGERPLDVTADLEMLCHQHIQNMKARAEGTATTQTAKQPPQVTANPTPPAQPTPQLIWEPQKPTIKGPWDKCVQIMNPKLQEIINHLTDHTFYSDDGFTFWLLTDQDNKENVKGVGRRVK